MNAAAVRTFVAVELTPEVVAALENMQAALRQGEGGRAGRWVAGKSIHLTLKFLGDVPAVRLEAVYRAVRRACATYRPLTITIAGVGCFPNARAPRIIWAGVRDETGQLAALQAAIEHELEREGFPRERRAFTPHLTLARVRHGAPRRDIEALGSAVAAYRDETPIPMRVTAISVMRSDLRPEGAIYTQLLAVTLPGDSRV